MNIDSCYNRFNIFKSFWLSLISNPLSLSLFLFCNMEMKNSLRSVGEVFGDFPLAYVTVLPSICSFTAKISLKPQIHLVMASLGKTGSIKSECPCSWEYVNHPFKFYFCAMWCRHLTCTGAPGSSMFRLCILGQDDLSVLCPHLWRCK